MLHLVISIIQQIDRRLRSLGGWLLGFHVVFSRFTAFPRIGFLKPEAFEPSIGLEGHFFFFSTAVLGDAVGSGAGRVLR